MDITEFIFFSYLVSVCKTFIFLLEKGTLFYLFSWLSFDGNDWIDGRLINQFIYLIDKTNCER